GPRSSTAMALGRTEPRRTHGTPPAVCPRLAAPAPAPQWLLAGRSRAVPTARHPRRVPTSRPPLQHRNGSWPDGAAPYPRHATRSCWHGVTTVVMGNCGFTLAPCAASDKHLVMRNLERAEDIAAEAMDAGIDWTWTTFPEFLDRVASLPKGINYACYIGHSALRTYVMGERAFEKPAGEDDLRAMERELRDAIRAGAIGFTTSRSPSHETPDRRP